MERKIIWEKWVDPMGMKSGQELEEFVAEEEYINNWEKYEQRKEQGNMVLARPAAITHFGILPINQTNDPSKFFDFWVGNTNFRIGEKTFEILNEKVLGIEILDIFSPYRFRISIGKAFTFQEIRIQIEKLLLVNRKPKVLDLSAVDIDPDLQKRVMSKVEELNRLSKYWIIYILPNGELEVSVPTDLNTFKHRYEILHKTRELAGGLLLSSNEFGV